MRGGVGGPGAWPGTGLRIKDKSIDATSWEARILANELIELESRGRE